MRSPSLIPNPMFSNQQYAQFYHHDIVGLSDSELRRELWARRPYLYRLSDIHDQREQLSWLEERVDKLEAEIMRRRKSSVFSNYTENKPKLAEGVQL